MTELYTKTSSGVERIDVSVPKIEERVTNLENNKLGKTEKAASALVADSATKATQDSSGNIISSTYATKSEVTSGLSGKLGKTEKASSANIADSVAWTGVTGKPSFATVATSGSYNDLTDKPNISDPRVPYKITGKPVQFSKSEKTPTAKGYSVAYTIPVDCLITIECKASAYTSNNPKFYIYIDNTIVGEGPEGSRPEYPANILLAKNTIIKFEVTPKNAVVDALKLTGTYYPVEV